MKLISLSLRQWRTFEHCDLEFPDGLIGVRGPNGAGKTTLAEAIGWALFGKVRPGGRIDDLRRQDAPKGEASTVELVFRIGPTVYRVERVVRGAAKLWIGDGAEPETTQTRATNSRIALELDMSWDVFHRTVFARQKDVAALDPAGTADARRRHVERLLGLERYRLAAEKARAEARSIADELTGRRADAPDVTALETELATAEQQAAEDDPAVEQATGQAEALRKRFDELVQSVDDEADPARKSVELEAERKRLTEVAELAETDTARLLKVMSEREEKAVRLEEIRGEAAGAGEAARKAELWRDLAEAKDELAAAEAELAAIAYDSTADDETTSSAAALRMEQTTCVDEKVALSALSASLQKRLVALEAAADAEPLHAARETLAQARKQQQEIRNALGIESHAREEDEAHLAAVAEGGGDTPCPVCLRPYGAEYETILAQYRSRIDERQSAIGTLEKRDAESVALLVKSEEALRAAEQAAAKLAETEGPSEVAAAKRELASTEAALKARTSRVSEIEADLKNLDAQAGRHVDARERWRAQEAIKNDRAGRVGRIIEELAIDEYIEQEHRAVIASAERLSALATEVERLSHDLAGSEEADEQKAAADLRARDARTAGTAIAVELVGLAYDPERLPALKGERDSAQAALDNAATALAEARAAAQARSETVRSLRERLDEGQRVRKAIDERALELDRYRVAAELLTEFRSYQSQRAWPHLEQGASAILSAATDGRYADVSLSDDFRIVVLDRGERHELSRFSGGEQDVTNLCLRLAIAEWVAQERGAEINFVILDEVFGSQDDERRQLLLGELRALGNRFQQLLVITHLADIADLCEHQIEVRLEEEGRSTASLETA